MRRRFGVLAVIVVGSVALAGCLKPGTSTPQTTPGYGPGLWHSIGGDTCYWARLRDLTGGTDSIIANGIGAGPVWVQLDGTEAGFQVNGCIPFEREDPAGPWAGTGRHDPSQPIGPGMYIAGLEMPAGTYATGGPAAGSSDCYWARLSNFTGVDDILANNIGQGPDVVQIVNGDVGFTTSGCQPWVRTG